MTRKRDVFEDAAAYAVQRDASLLRDKCLFDVILSA